ncbi:Minus-end-directed kinesin ATPase [Handroanthus impetiginosus]|uniref:Minus-end-directed kinesin ATPase n=1 Tax=Handroanthus impetiginosus TaxID=429701 RepID=A0A2G9G775_9LAMI|nr:Minus-end-directed kinesin ATPase [Handroanthus impetiginosus]
MDRQVKDSNVFEPASSNNGKINDAEHFVFFPLQMLRRVALVEWLNDILPELSLPINASDEELRAFLVDGSVLCRILNKLKPGCVTQCSGSVCSSENVERFLTAMDEMGLPRFQQADLEKGSMKIVLDCLLTLQTHFTLNGNDSGSRRRLSGERVGSVDGTPREETFRLLSSPPFGEDRRKLSSDLKFQRALRSTVITEPSAAVINHVGHKFHEVFQLKQGSYRDLPAAKISEMMKSNSLDNAPTQSLLSVVNGILDESIERKHGEIPHQNNLFKAREEKYQSRIRVLEALATGTSEETQIVMNQLQQIKV